MKTATSHALSFALSCSLLAGCEDVPPPVAKELPPAKVAMPPPVPRAAPSPPQARPPALPLVLGMETPFARHKPEVAKRLEEGHRLMRKKKFGEARAAFHEVVTAHPDDTASRYAEVRAAVLMGDVEAVPELWRELVMRDYVGYAGRLAGSKDMSPLRSSPVWSQIEGIESEIGAAFRKPAARGLVFVARHRPSTKPSFEDGRAVAKIELNQEVYELDLGSRRIRRLTATSGRVLGVHRDPARGQLMLLLGQEIAQTDHGVQLRRPQAAVLQLDTLEMSQPLSFDADPGVVDLCYSTKGEPIYSLRKHENDAARSFTFDATGMSLVAMSEGCGDATGALTRITSIVVEHRRAHPEGVTVSDDGLAIDGVDPERAVRATKEVRKGSLDFSPGKKRFSWTGPVKACTDAPDERNGLYVWSSVERKAVRLAHEPTVREATWIDDDRLAYELGPGKLVLHDFTGPGPTVLKAPAGAALFGIAPVGCAQGVDHAMLK